MMGFKCSSSIAALIGATLLTLPKIQAGPYVISDARVRSLDVTPVLGRGYSIMTNSFQSICLEVDETTVPSFNYDYEFTDFTENNESETDTTTVQDKTDELSGLFAYDYLKKEIDKNEKSTVTATEKKHYVISSMRVERYYASVRENVSPLVDDAITLLQRQDYVGFFKSCGSNYVRGIRRAQEVTAIFSFTSSSEELAKEYAASLQTTRTTNGGGSSAVGSLSRDTTSKSKFTAVNESLEIKIMGFGLGLTDAPGTLVATSLNEYNDIMKFAFKAMTASDKESIHVGMVYGIEVVPWVDNLAFQVQSNILDEVIELPLARSLLQRAFETANKTNYDFDNNNRAAFSCKNPDAVIDLYGYCCEPEALYDTSKAEYDATSPETKICRPVRELDKTLVKSNMASNGEFVARLDAAVRNKLNTFATLEKCISAASAFPPSMDYYILKGQDAVNKDDFQVPFTVFDIKTALDPFGDYSMVTHMGKEIEEFMDMYVSPCYSALFGMNSGSTADVDSNFFLAYPWHTHKECTKLSCLARGMRWDRANGGCTAGLLVGTSAITFDGGNNYCSFDTDASETEQKCKHDGTELQNFAQDMNDCWQSLPSGGILNFLDFYCLPQLTGEQVTSGDRYTEITNAKNSPCSRTRSG